jgi:hypothetical protein
VTNALKQSETSVKPHHKLAKFAYDIAAKGIVNYPYTVLFTDIMTAVSSVTKAIDLNPKNVAITPECLSASPQVYIKVLWRILRIMDKRNCENGQPQIMVTKKYLQHKCREELKTYRQMSKTKQKKLVKQIRNAAMNTRLPKVVGSITHLAAKLIEIDWYAVNLRGSHGLHLECHGL